MIFKMLIHIVIKVYSAKRLQTLIPNLKKNLKNNQEIWASIHDLNSQPCDVNLILLDKCRLNEDLLLI